MWRGVGAAYRRGMTPFIVHSAGRAIYEERVAAGIRAAELRRLSIPQRSRRLLRGPLELLRRRFIRVGSNSPQLTQ